MKIRDIKAAVLQRLYREYEQQGLNWGIELAELQSSAPGTPSATLEATVDDFYSLGLVTHEDMSENMCIRLTVAGIEAIEDPATEAGRLIVHAVNVNGGYVQIGSHNQQTVTYQNVINSLVDHVERAADVSPEQKNRWAQTLREIAVHPCTHTAVSALAGLATEIAMK